MGSDPIKTTRKQHLSEAVHTLEHLARTKAYAINIGNPRIWGLFTQLETELREVRDRLLAE